MRATSFGIVLAMLSQLSFATEEGDVLFFAPFEGELRAMSAAGNPVPKAVGKPHFGKGVRGQAVRLDKDAILTFLFHGNVTPDEGTIVMWAKPEWPVDDKRVHFLFRASTGSFGGKALNAIMLYKYMRDARLLFYLSNGQETSPSEGRALASRGHVEWPVGQWMHFAATWSATLAATEMRLYIDGQRVDSARTAVFAPDQAPRTFDLGGPRGAGATWFDDVIIFNRPLTPDEVAALCQSYRKGLVADAEELPFIPSEGIAIEPYVNFQRGQMRVRVDYRAGRKQLGDKSGRLRVEVLGADETIQREVDATRLGVANLAFDYPRVKSGPRRIRATLMNAEDVALRQSEVAYRAPDKPEWIGNDLGKSPDAPPPWTPVHAEGDTLEVWGRAYTFDDSPLPARIASQGRELLRSPVQLSLQQGGTRFHLEMHAENVTASDGASARSSWKGGVGPLEATAMASLEFDGFLRVDMTLTPRAKVPARRLDLTIPMRGQTATLYHHANGSWSNLSEAGAIPGTAWRKSLAFVPYVWVGDERTGLAWVCEHNDNWRNANENAALEIVRTHDGVDLRVRLCDVETVFTRPLRFSFGFLATPVKPLPKDWRNWRQVFISAHDLEGFANARPALPAFRNIGVLYNNHVGRFSYLPANPAEVERKIAFLHSRGWRTIIPYFALSFTQINTPAYKVMEREWRRDPFSQNTTAGKEKMPYGSVCVVSSWADFLVWAIAKTMDETGAEGVYLDCSNPCFCRSAEHGCAPGRYPIFATRALQKRIYKLVKSKRGDEGFVYSHNSENNILTTFAFSDAALNGEQYNKKDLRTLSFAKFRAEFLPYSSGIPNFLLPTLTKRQPAGKEKMSGAEFLAFPLLHDVICVPAWVSPETRSLLAKIRAVMSEFGVADADFLPYWSNGSTVSVSPDGATISAYLRSDGAAALLIAQGTKTPKAFAVSLRGRLAPLRGRPARNALTQRPLSWDDGKLRWDLLGRDVQLAWIGARGNQ